MPAAFCFGAVTVVSATPDELLRAAIGVSTPNGDSAFVCNPFFGLQRRPVQETGHGRGYR